MDIKVKYSEKLLAELTKYDIPFSYDEENEDKSITIEVKSNVEFSCNTPASEIISSLIPIINRKLIIKHHASVSNIGLSRLNTDILYITCWTDGTNDDYTQISYPTLFWDKKEQDNVSGQSDLLKYNNPPEFILAVNDDFGTPIAYIGYNIIHICFDIFHIHKLYNLHKSFLSDLVKFYVRSEDNLKTLYEAYQITKTRIEFIKYLKSNHNKKINSLEREISSLNSNISAYNRNLVTSYSQLREKSLEINILKQVEPNYEEEVEKLITLYSIDFLPNGNMVIHTEDIIINDILIGKFDIKINNSDGSIMVQNITKKAGNIDHPHIRNGVMCFGDLQTEINKQISEGKLLEVSSLIVELLYFYNPASAFANISEWQKWEELWGPNGIQH